MTISDVHTFILRKFDELKPYSVKPYSQLSSKFFRIFINLCTSVSIKLMQYDMLPNALKTLIKASEADKLLCELGSMSDQCWQGRLLTHHCLAFLYYRSNQIKKSLTILHEGQKIVEVIMNSKLYLSPDFALTANLLIFMNLWKAKKYQEAKEYIESAKTILLQISKLGVKSKISSLSRLNLNGIIAIATAGIFLSENYLKKAVETLEKALDFLLGDEVMARPLVYRFLSTLRTPEKIDLNTVISKEFDSIILVSCFIPYVTAGTPSIKIVEPPQEFPLRTTSRISSLNSNRKNVSLPQSRIRVRNQLTKSWWNNTTFIAKKGINQRRASATAVSKTSKNSSKNSSLENSVVKGRVRLYSPSVKSNYSTERKKNMQNRAATMAELPLQVIKGLYNRPLSSK